jgi:uncharacterized membrane protein YcaP (DUF421 family)
MDIVARATVIFLVVFVVLRVVGRRELGNLEPFDLILLVVLGDLVQQGVTQSDYSVTGAIIAILTIAVLTVLVSYLGFRFRRLRPLLEGEPIILFADGRPIERNMRRERITLDDLAAEARLQNLASLDEVRLAVLEASGQISIIPRSREMRRALAND